MLDDEGTDDESFDNGDTSRNMSGFSYQGEGNKDGVLPSTTTSHDLIRMHTLTMFAKVIGFAALAVGLVGMLMALNVFGAAGVGVVTTVLNMSAEAAVISNACTAVGGALVAGLGIWHSPKAGYKDISGAGYDDDMFRTSSIDSTYD